MDCVTALAPGSAKCSGCIPGKYVNSTKGCSNCTLGKYTNKMDLKFCLECPKGFFGDVVGSRESPYCKSCDRGKVGKLIGATNASSTCFTCFAGRYSDQDGRALRSEAGLSWLELLATDCQPCPRGRFSTTVGSKKESNCISCTVGRYSSTDAASSIATCLLCNAGKFSVDVGAVHIDTCEHCPAGFYQKKKKV